MKTTLAITLLGIISCTYALECLINREDTVTCEDGVKCYIDESSASPTNPPVHGCGVCPAAATDCTVCQTDSCNAPKGRGGGDSKGPGGDSKGPGGKDRGQGDRGKGDQGQGDQGQGGYTVEGGPEGDRGKDGDKPNASGATINNLQYGLYFATLFVYFR